MNFDPWHLYRLMYKSRFFEEIISKLWSEGLISGEMHLGTGEEAIVASVVSNLEEGDSMALDHRSTPPLIMRGADPESIMKEMLGMDGGLCRGRGGHMHFFSKELLSVSSGIVGASGPTAAGFALAANYFNSGTVSIAFFGEGSINQGVLMESMNLAVVWKLPVLFVCKDDNRSITTSSEKMTGGNIKSRAEGFGLEVFESEGTDLKDVWEVSSAAVSRTRKYKTPVFLHIKCIHPEGHFLGYQLKRIFKNPVKEIPSLSIPIVRSMIKKGSSLGQKMSGLKNILSAMSGELKSPGRKKENDPLFFAKKFLDDDIRLHEIESSVQVELNLICEKVFKEYQDEEDELFTGNR